MKTIENFRTEQEASIYTLSLKEIGIESIVQKKDGGPYPTLTDLYGYSVIVRDEDYQKALEHLPKNTGIIENKKENVKPESIVTDPPGKNWYLYGGLISGIIIGLILNWLYSTVHYHLHLGTKYYYYNGELSKVVKDRNGDHKDDYWEFYLDNYFISLKADDNFDGKVDSWWKDNNYEVGIQKNDIDSNEIPDITIYFENDIPKKSFVHPNNEQKKIIYREYSPVGLLENEYIDTDENGGYDLKRSYDPLGKYKSEEKIKDTTINHF